MSFSEESDLSHLRDVLCNIPGDVTLANRFRALFYLKSIASELSNKTRADTAITYISQAFEDQSELLKHEVAYVLGQSKNMTLAPMLREVLKLETSQQIMVRHELLELLGALNDTESLPLLEHYFTNDPLLEIRQTCELLIDRIKWSQSSNENINSIYESIDPAPPLIDTQSKVPILQKILNDQDKPLFERYRAMFRLRDIGTDELLLLLATGFDDESALFKHEIAYVFGQLCNPCTVPLLIKVLQDKSELGMVRHELLELLGSIAVDDVLPILKSFLNDEEDVVRDSAVVALDMYEYENSNEIEYAHI